MTPQAFFSLSGKDAQFVDQVWKQLPDGLAFFYQESFKTGEKLLEAMERGVDQSQVFVFFVSQASIESHWVQFELDEARLASITRPNFKILVFPLAPNVAPSQLPQWMQRYWIPKAGYGVKDIARYIRQILTNPPIGLSALSVPVVGRGQLLDVATQRWMLAISEANSDPNVFLVAGVAGIGRRTFARYFVEQAMPALPNLSFGPELHLPEFADLADLYRGLREQIDQDFSFDAYERDLTAFRDMNLNEQVDEILRFLSHFAKLGQAVFVGTGSGLFEDRGNLKEWVLMLIEGMSGSEAKLCLISNRQVREETAREWGHLVQIYVPPLKDADIRALMTATSTVFKIKPVSPTDDLIRSIGGHPQIAKAAVRLIAQKGEHILDRQPSTLFSIQDEVLSENLNVDSLSEVQKEILCILSWVPALEGKLIEQTIRTNKAISETDFIKALEDLILGCLVLVTERNFIISAAIRQMYRRKYGFGQKELLERFSAALNAEWQQALDANELRNELFDAFVFMHSLEGKSLPSELARLLLPSTLHEIVRDTYRIATTEADHDALRRVINWGSVAKEMKMDETVREEILSTVAHSYVRLTDYKKADELIQLFDAKGYRNASFLRGFSFRRQHKYREAIPYLREAVATKKYLRGSVQELALCYKQLGMARELADLVESHNDIVEEIASLLDFKIGSLIAGGRLSDAEAAIHRLQFLKDDDGRSVMRRAQILMQRDHNFREAERILTVLIQNKIGRPITVRRWRAVAAIGGGNLSVGKQDVEFIRARDGNMATVHRLEVYLALAQSDFEGAERAYALMGQEDDLLRARILEARAFDIRTPLAERESLRNRASVLKARNRLITEFDVE